MKFNFFLKNGLLLTFTSLILRSISIVFNIFLCNKIDSATIGIWGIIMSVFAFLLTVSMSGINLSTTRLVAEENSYGFIKNIPIIMCDCFKYCLFFSFLSIFILLFFNSYIINVILDNSISVYLLYILAITLPICSLSSCLNGYFMAINKIKIIIISQILEVLIQIIFVLIFLKSNYFNTTNQICLILIIGLILSDFCSFFYLFYNYFLHYKSYNKFTSKKLNYKKRICKISIPVAFTTYIKSGLSALKNSLIPIAFVSYGFSYNEALSYYGIISGTIMTLLLFPYTFIQSYSNLLIPKISSYNIKSDMKKIIKITKKSLILTCVFSIVSAIILIIFSHWIDKYLYKNLSVESFIKLLSPIIIYIYMDNVIDSILKSLDLQVFVMIINIIDLIVSILLIKYLIPLFGIYGYIFILYFSEVFNFLFSLFVLNYKLKNNFCNNIISKQNHKQVSLILI